MLLAVASTEYPVSGVRSWQAFGHRPNEHLVKVNNGSRVFNKQAPSQYDEKIDATDFKLIPFETGNCNAKTGFKWCVTESSRDPNKKKNRQKAGPNSKNIFHTGFLVPEYKYFLKYSFEISIYNIICTFPNTIFGYGSTPYI